MIDATSLRLVAITDSLRDGIAGLSARAASAVAGGVTMIQLRLVDESPRVLVEVGRALRAAAPGVPLIVHDRADVALAAGAQGVHLGVAEIAPAALRRATPEGFIIGVSVGDDADLARVAGADYVGIGPLFGPGGRSDAAGLLGPQWFAELSARSGLPAVAIGGVTAANAGDVMRAGAAGIAVISALFGSSDPTAAARALRFAQDASGR